MENIKFKIEHMDPLGQGVSKENKIAFIEKTLPGETGTAEVYRKAKGVIFGRLINTDKLEKISEARIIPECPHYNECRGCQYLHTNYENELKFKSQSLERMFKQIIPESVKIETHPAKKRYKYRNRVQIHYNFDNKELGLISSHTEHFINASDCLLPDDRVKETVSNLYNNNNWEDVVINNKKKGYIEVYLKPEEAIPLITVNKPYAEGGFTQVNNNMGKVLSDLVSEMYNKYLDNSREILVLDIFGGNGNLSKGFKNFQTIVYDFNSNSNIVPKLQNKNQTYKNIDLYKRNPVNQIINSLKNKKLAIPNLIVFDPPRAGVKFIDSYLKNLNTSYIFYISCDPATLKRDTLEIIKHYNIMEMHLIDLFPGTRHFETFIVFKNHMNKRKE